MNKEYIQISIISEYFPVFPKFNKSRKQIILNIL